MDTLRESVCCQEIDKIKHLLVDEPPPTCIIDHPEFYNVCLNRTILTVALHGYSHHYGSSDVPPDENR